MRHHRFSHLIPMERQPEPQQPAVNPAAFCLCPASMMPAMPPDQWLMRQMIYQMAFQQAQAVVRPSLPERDLLAVWN